MIESEAEFLEVARQVAGLHEDILRLGRSDDPVCLTAASIARADLGRLQQQLWEYDCLHNAGRKGDWFVSIISGNRFWPEDPRPEEIHLDDIAHSLARLSRFNGHTLKTYSVAQHSVYVSRVVDQRFALFALFHDASEAYLGDVISPLKRLIKPIYSSIEERVMEAIARRFGFEMTEEAFREVKRADTILLATEARDLTRNMFVRQPLSELPLDDPITLCWCDTFAEREFRRRFEDLTLGRKPFP